METVTGKSGSMGHRGILLIILALTCAVSAGLVLTRMRHSYNPFDPAHTGEDASPVQHDEFILDSTNSLEMTGTDDQKNERWMDIAGNCYNQRFREWFTYQKRQDRPTSVRVRIDSPATTLKGRIEARGLKPNFAYQLKLCGTYHDRQSFEIIGYSGRWRLPGEGTNYDDYDYARYPHKGKVEAFLLFDYFVTDMHGNAVYDFALKESLHVLWNTSRQHPIMRGRTCVRPFKIEAANSAVYQTPRAEPTIEVISAEKEWIRYRRIDDHLTLPPCKYNAELRLTEESFHSSSLTGGYWATVMSCPISFEIRKQD